MRTADDMIDKLRGRKIPYDDEINNSIDYAIACIKSCESLEITAKKYIKLQADYETRLKADMVAMLTDIQSEFEEIEVAKENAEIRAGECCMKGACIDLIQQKINALKADINPQKSKDT